MNLAKSYRKIVLKRLTSLGILALQLGISFLVDASVGPSDLSPIKILQSFYASPLSQINHVIFWEIRLPYALMAVLIGASLGLAGAESQTILHNPLASPHTLGVTAAATFGAAIAIVFDFAPAFLSTNWSVSLSAFFFSFLAILLIQYLSQKAGGGVHSIILFGVALMFAMNALLSLVLFLADANSIQQIVFWTMGSLVKAKWSSLGILSLALVLCSFLSYLHINPLNSIVNGDDYALAQGVPVKKIRLQGLLRISLLAAVAVSFAGTIGFIGLVAPHIARMLLGGDHRFYLPGSMLVGAFLLSISSILSQTLKPGVILPIGIITAIVGIPLFLFLILRQKKNS